MFVLIPDMPELKIGLSTTVFTSVLGTIFKPIILEVSADSFFSFFFIKKEVLFEFPSSQKLLCRPRHPRLYSKYFQNHHI